MSDGYLPTNDLRWRAGPGCPSTLEQRFVSTYVGEEDEWRKVHVERETAMVDGGYLFRRAVANTCTSGWLETRLAKWFGSKIISRDGNGARLVMSHYRGKLYLIGFEASGRLTRSPECATLYLQSTKRETENGN